MNLFAEIDKANAAYLEATGIKQPEPTPDPVKAAMERRRRDECAAQDFLAANPSAWGVTINGAPHGRKF